jgi:glucose-6-phosphate isomerase
MAKLFSELDSYLKLKALSSNPVDLTKAGVVTPKRIKNMKSEACGYKLLYAMERMDDKILNSLFDLAKETSAIKKMRSMQEGEVINKIEGFDCENRSVLHTAMRDFFENPIQESVAKEATKKAYIEVEKLKKFLTEIEGKYTTIIQVGIGGSDLGPRALYASLKAYQKPDKNVYFISNVDPDDATSVLKCVDLSKTLIVSVSKSGTTLETLTNEQVVRDALKKKGLDPKNHIVSVTGKGSPMDDASKYLASFYIWDYVGGRYSATSMVGGVTLGFALGFDCYMQILKGANQMDKNALEEDLTSNLPLIAALIGIWNRNFLQLDSLAVVPYSEALLRFPAHLQQCDMESNGKSIDKEASPITYETGPIIWGEAGTNAQHSFFQYIHQGTTIVPTAFIGFKENQYQKDIRVEKTTSQEKLLANLFAQSLALAIGKKDKNPNKTFFGNRPNHILLGKRLDPSSMGALLAFFEHKIAFQGFIWNINSFDQEGVQLGKILANRFINLMKGEKEDFNEGSAYLEELKFI